MKATNRTVFTRSALAVAVSLASASSFGADLPTGGTITSGAGAISQSGDTLTVQQDSSRLISNWQSFNIGSGHTVNFQQPDNQAVALNRVIGEDASAIFGNLNANGKVFLINPNGVLFGQGASVNVGSLVASTLNLSDDDFLNERYTLRGDGDNAPVINRGHIQADNGAVALLGGHVSNQGVIQANMGSVALAAGNQVTLDFAGDGLLEVTVDESTIDALVENKELIRANGGQVLMTAKATDAVLETVVNNEGVIEAQTLQNQEGRILLLGGFDGGTVNVAGTLDASAPAALNTEGGDGGFIDTSGAHVEVADGTIVNTLAANGQTGEWLIDPTDIVIDPGSAVLDNLDTTDVTLDTASAGSDPGNITVNTDINWSTDNTLTLNADNNIAINGDVSGAIGTLVLNAAGDIDVTGSVNLGVLDLISGNWAQVGASLPSFSVNDFQLKEDTATYLRALAGDGTTDPYQIFDVYGLQGMESRSLLGSDFVLANDIDASGTVNWHAGAGFDPIGISGQRFTGDFNGQGYIIDGLSIQRSTERYVGLFGATNAATLRNVGLSDIRLVGELYVGSLVGLATDSSIENSFASNGQVIAQINGVGGLIGAGVGGSLQNSYADVAVQAEANGNWSGLAGGLLGSGSTNIGNSYASGDVSSPGNQVGGLVGQYNGAGTISDSYATGQVNGSSAVGGVVGSMLSSASLSQVFWNQDANPGLNGVGNDAAATGVAGKTLTELQNLATFTGAGWDIDAEGGTGSVWRIYDGYTTPLLRSFLTSLEVLPEYDGSGTHQNNIAGVDRTEWDAADASHLFGTPGSGDQLTLAGSDTAGEFLAYSDATANLYSDQQGYDLITTRTIVDNNVTNGGDIALTNGVSWDSGTLRIDTTGNITSIGAIDGGTGSVFDLISGNWTQVGNSLPSFSVNNFQLKEDTATYLRALVGDGTTDPYQIFDVYGLQGMESHSLLGSDFVLANDIDASGTVNWHAGAGFDPIGMWVSGCSGTCFAGRFDGQGNEIRDLSIDRGGEDYIGLFGVTAASATVANVGLVDSSITGYRFVGGLAGGNLGSIRQSYVSGTGSVSGESYVGGLVGANSGVNGASPEIRESYATVAVTGSGSDVGGLVGNNFSGTVSQSYATGAVSGGANVGGLIGRNDRSVSQSYATGAVSGGFRVGGLVGYNDSGTATGNFFATTDESGNPINVGLSGIGYDEFTRVSSNSGAAPKTLAELQTLSTFTAEGWDIDAEGGTGSVWRIYDGYTTPLLRSFLTALEVLPDYDGSGTHQNNIAGVDRTEWDAADASHLFGTPGSGDQLTLAGSDTAGEYLAYSDATANLYSDQQGYDLITTRTIVDNNVTNAGDVALTNGVSWGSGTLRVDTTGNITSIGAIDGGTGSVFDLISGNWTQVGASLPSFSVNDFQLKEDTATFLRALAGDGTGADPYQIFDVYGLQGMESRSLLNSDFVLANDIDASGTVNWHAGAGFDPIGDFNTVSFGGSFDGQGHEIRDLSIDRGGEDHIGLFGTTAASATLANVGLVDSSINGKLYVGGLAGVNLGDIRQSYVSGVGSVSGESYVGGLVGANSPVNGATPEIRESYATIAVTGSGSDVGGLVGQNAGTVSQSYATGAVSGGGSVGGVIGYNYLGTVTGNFFATTDTNGDPINVGLSGIGMDVEPLGGMAPSNTGAMPRTLAELQTLSTFTAEGWDIDAEGGTGSVWRIYDGYTTPLLRAFLTELNVDATDTTYNGTYQNALWNIVGPYDASQVLGQIAGGGQDAGSYSVDMSGLYSSQQGYDLVADSNFVIDKAAATVTANSDTTTYNGTGQSVTGFTATGLVNGEDETVLSGVTTSGGTGTNAGSYTHTASGTDGNYILTFVDGALTIDKAAAMVTANSDTVTYNGTSQSVAGFTATGLVNGETESVLSGVTTSGGTGTNAGSYSHTASGTDGNYILTFVDGALTIDKAAATVTANSDTATYNGTSQSVTGFTATGLVNGEDETVLSGVTTSGGTGTNAGSYTHTASGSDGNYTLTFVDGALTIDKAAVTVTANSDSTTYNGTSQSVTGFTATGLVNGEDETVLSGVTTSGGTGTNAGSYTHIASGADGNYLLTFVGGELTIDKAAATVTANSDTTTYNGTSQSVAGFTATGLVNGETESVLSGVTTSGGTGTNAGSYTHTASGTDGNYILTFVDGELTIDPASIQVSTTDVNRAYDGTTNADGTAVLVGGTLFGTDALSGADFAFDDANAGTGKTVTVGNVTVADGNGGNNYVVSTVNGTGNIGKRALTAEVTAQNKVFDGTQNVTLSGLLNGLVTGDDVSLILDGLFASSLAGNDVPVSFTALLAGADAGNYDLMLPATVDADILEFRSTEAYQSAMVSRPPEERRLSLPEEPEFVLQIDEDALRMSR